MLGFLGKQFIDVIEWNEPADGILAFRVPMADHEIQNGARLTVRQSQTALFINEGQIADVFAPGAYQLTTRTLPILTNLKNWDKAFASPFKSDVYFFSTRDQLDQRWGTATPIVMRDRDFGAMHVRAYGTFAYRIEDPRIFFARVSGTRDIYTSAEVEDHLRSVVMTTLASFLATGEVPFVEMAARQRVFSELLLEALGPQFTPYGLKLTALNVQSISLPEEVQDHLDRGTSMRMIGNLDGYLKFRAADGLSQPGSAAGEGLQTGVTLGAGAALGQIMAQSFGAAGDRAQSDVLTMLARLHELFKQGALTRDEYDAQKSILLSRER